MKPENMIDITGADRSFDGYMIDTPFSIYLMKQQGGVQVPSRKGYHILTKPFDRRLVDAHKSTVASLHYDNPTNLYIPTKAA